MPWLGLWVYLGAWGLVSRAVGLGFRAIGLGFKCGIRDGRWNVTALLSESEPEEARLFI